MYCNNSNVETKVENNRFHGLVWLNPLSKVRCNRFLPFTIIYRKAKSYLVMSANLNRSNTDPNVPFASPLEWSEHLFDLRKKMAFLAFSHTTVEHRLYEAMLAEVTASGLSVGVFGVRRLINLTGLSSNSSVRRGCLGLVKKLSVEPAFSVSSQHKSLYHIYSPEEIFRRRQSAGLEPFSRDFVRYQNSQMMGFSD
ncbi:MAG: hypothetical protein WKF84_20820 [Pyrinomonadaceae bacterium]